MKKSIRCAAVIAAILCMSLAGCKSNGSLSEKDIENRLEQLDGDTKPNNTNTKPSGTVSDPEPEKLDPFEKLEVTFNGTAPSQSNVTVSGGDAKITYTPSVQRKVMNGDVITVTAELKSSYKDKYVLTQTEKDYTVEGLPYYAQKIADIPQEAYDKMDKYMNDQYTAHMAGNGTDGKIEGFELLGNWMLVEKPEVNVSGDHTRLYFVYKMTVDFGTKQNVGVVEYYMIAYFRNIIILPDGTASLEYSINKGLGEYFAANGYIVEAYNSDLDTAFSKNITANIGYYNYESTVEM